MIHSYSEKKIIGNYGIIYDFDLYWILAFFGQPRTEVPLGRRRADDPEPRLRVRPSRRQRHVPTSLRLARLTHSAQRTHREASEAQLPRADDPEPWLPVRAARRPRCVCAETLLAKNRGCGFLAEFLSICEGKICGRSTHLL